ncbi:MAG: Z1 domain-containing protein [Clostridiales bacterium]|nr:Z1 domain-containing protein [Clostridiales bacterium]
MFGIISKAADLGFPVFLLLTTDNVVLQQQTLERVKADLDGYCICGENDSKEFMENSLLMPVIVVLKKNVRMLKLWANVFSSTGFMRGNPLFIVDDAADAASLNTLVNRNRQSSINKYLDSIKNGASSSLYLQVTGTPQAILLQTLASGWHPYFTYYFQPGDAYLGGDFFFPESGRPNCIEYLENCQNSTRDVLLHHIAVSAQILSAGGKVCNCLVHPSVRQAVHKKFADEILKEIQWCKDSIDGDFKECLEKQYSTLFPAKSELQDFSVVFEKAKELVCGGKIKVLIMNGKNNIESSEYEFGSNIVIGGNTLGRGVTFPGLHTIYYTRSSKKPQADTMWQHSRMFGYDRDPGMMKVYIDEHLYKLFSDINATNNSIIAQVERGIQDIKIYYPEGLNPTRKNVLDNEHVEIISGGTNYYPFYPDNDSIDTISKILEPFESSEPYYQVSLNLIKEVLTHIIPSPDFKMTAFQSVLTTILADAPTAQGILIVRRERNVTQGTGALLSPNDWQLGASFTDKPVLTMYQVTGTKGWGGRPLWVPNIKLPHNTVYYNVFDEEDKC